MTLGLILSLCLVAPAQVTAAGNTWYVDDGGNDITGDGSPGNPWATIQHAIDDAGVTDDDTIIVGDGNYTENITVNKSLVIQSQNGAASTTITPADNGLDVFNITVDNVIISGFTISRTIFSLFAGIILSGTAGDQITGCTISNNILNNNVAGIWLDYADDNIISANNCDGNCFGIYLVNSRDNMITGNSCMNEIPTEGITSGIMLADSTYNTISNNRCNRNGNGITVYQNCFNNTISNNYCADNNHMGGSWIDGATGYGILLMGPAENNYIFGNTCGRYYDEDTSTDYDENEKSGICLSDYESAPSNNNIIAGNICNYNPQSGIRLDFDEDYNTGNILMGNTCNNNHSGISVSHSHYTVIFNNELEDNTQYGIYVTGDNAKGNRAIYNTITGNVYGIYATLEVFSDGIFIHSNNISGNSGYGVYNQDSEGTSGDDIDASNNWWGDASGPDDDAGGINGSGDKASTYVNCGEWADAQKDAPEILTTTETTTSSTTATAVSTATSITTSTSVAVSTSMQINIQTQTEISTVTIIITQSGTTTTFLILTTVTGSTTETTTLPGSTMTFTYSSTLTSTQSGTSAITTAIPPSITLTTTLTLTDETIDWTITIILTICGLLTGGVIVTIIIRRK
jgi:parallel beta-helix repeat protein